MAENRESTSTRYNAKGLLLGLTALCLAGVAVWFAYAQFFTKGLERLPSKICEGTVERDTVIQVLPSARSAEEGSKRGNPGDDQVFSCNVATSGDSSLLGRSWVRPVSKADWLESYGGSGGNSQVIHTSVGGIEALAQLDTEQAAVYVPCVSPALSSDNASDDYAVITRLEAGGDLKATGAALRQNLTDIAYQLTKHAYKLAKCQGSRDFPGELPRYEDG
ncbi:hypothetical protein AB0C98_38140 [Streptomyces sp. NPDC048558]|uniref:hypothetical protein n=1 Tax=Streptomyces sp. NPDC048558 TaxID=3155759 RepID=UPI003432046C